ncbi:hypothetical protein GCM10010252_39170 [Streptomyces aureoverticillatus]|nr:hypothetical protein GCM10010252_39170 [Streptomyces aureoverticillatus]
MGRRGFAARAGVWSAQHRWAAVGVWILFVVLAAGIGSAVGRAEAPEDDLRGETSQAQRITDDAGVEEPTGPARSRRTAVARRSSWTCAATRTTRPTGWSRS